MNTESAKYGKTIILNQGNGSPVQFFIDTGISRNPHLVYDAHLKKKH